MLEVLADTERGLSASRIARLAPRGTRAGHAHVLDRLVAQGLVLADEANQGYLYRLNRQHVLAPAVLAAAGARRSILERLAEAARQLSPLPPHVSVFGSFARGEAGPDSDIDMLIVGDGGVEPDDTAEGLRDLEDQVMAWTGNRCHAVHIEEDHLRALVRRREPIVDTWLRDEVLVLGRPLHQLLIAPTSSAHSRPARVGR
ncbi:MAG: nucleotidyltransferase domain-containing protein [Motilibacteraceae bacterium]